MRILFVHNDYGRPSGEESAIRAICEALEDGGHQTLQYRRSSAGLDASFSGKVTAFFSGIHSFRAQHEIESFLAANPVDLVQIQNLYPLISPSILSVIKRHSIPIVMRCPNYRLFCPSGLHVHKGKVCERCLGGREWNCAINNCEGDIFKSAGYAIRSFAARVSKVFGKHVDIFIVLSEFQKRHFVANGIPAHRVEILPNFSSSKDTLQPVNDVPVGHVVSFVGRLAPEKGIELFIQAAQRLPDIPFAAAGDDRELRATRRRLPPNLKLMGFLEGDALQRFYEDSRVLCVPSQWFEGFPNVVLRAMECAKPVITSSIGALPEIVVDGQTGLLHDPASVEQLTTCIRRLYDDPELSRRYGLNGHRRACERFGQQAGLEQLLSIYSRARQISARSDHSVTSARPLSVHPQ